MISKYLTQNQITQPNTMNPENPLQRKTEETESLPTKIENILALTHFMIDRNQL